MRARTLLIASLGLNVLLAALWLASRSPRADEPVSGETELAVTLGEIRTNVVVRRQFFSWEELESEDYPTYIANLRSINCPEETIRDIIIADVDDLFAQRQRAETLPATQQWWQSAPDPEVARLRQRQEAALLRERDGLLTKLLGPDWNLPPAPGPTVAIKVPLEGPVLGSLAPETQEAVQSLGGRMQQDFERWSALNGGAEPEPAALAALEQQLKSDLTPLLTPSQLEEFMLKFSPTAHRLRAELSSVTLFKATELETQNLFRNLESIDLQLMSLGDGQNADAQRQALLSNREIAFQNALGPARFREYQLLQDPAYASAAAAAQAAGIDEAAVLFYAIEQAGQQTEAGIRTNPNLTPLQQEAAVKEVELEQLKAVGVVLNEPVVIEPPAPPKRTYSFEQGDTIAAISRRTGVPVALILRANPGLQPEGIPVGTRIVIPDRTAPFP